MLALIKNVGALEALALEALPATVAPPLPHTNRHLSRTHPVHTNGLENMTFPLQMVHNSLMHELKSFPALRAIPTLSKTVIWTTNLRTLLLKRHSFWTIQCMGPFLNHQRQMRTIR